MIFFLVLQLSSFACTKIKVSDYRNCPSLAPRDSPPLNVRDLRPDDIGVIMAMGDSLIAGLNSRVPHKQPFASILPDSHSKTEYRGVSFATGGDSDSTSVGNILSHYNPSICGLSKGNSSFIYCYGPICPAGTKVPFEPIAWGLNAAQSGSWTSLYNSFNQLKYFDRFYDSFIPKDMGDPWKLLIMEFGFNNICLGCLDLTSAIEFSVKHFEYQMKSLLEELRSRYSKMFINIVGPFGLKRLMDFQKNFEDCRNLPRKFVTCICSVEAKVGANGLARMEQLAESYNQKLQEIAKEYQDRNYIDFTVVFDPSLGQAVLQNGSIDLISGDDCFHPSHISHNKAGIAIWNNLFSPPEEKGALFLNASELINCPDDELYNSTSKGHNRDLSCLTREELATRLRITEAALETNSNDLKVAAQIGQHLLNANQSLQRAYDDLLTCNSTLSVSSDTQYSMISPSAVRSLASLPTTPIKFKDTALSTPSPRKLYQSFDLSDYVESLEEDNSNLSHELKTAKRDLMHAQKNILKLTKELDIATLEVEALRQQSYLKRVVRDHGEDHGNHHSLNESMTVGVGAVVKEFKSCKMQIDTLRNTFQTLRNDQARYFDGLIDTMRFYNPPHKVSMQTQTIILDRNSIDHIEPLFIVRLLINQFVNYIYNLMN